MSRFINPDVGFTLINGEANALGTVYFGEPNQDAKTNPKVPFLDAALITPAASTQGLTAGGKLQQALFLKGDYSLIADDVDDTQVDEVLNYTVFIDTADVADYTELRALPVAQLADGQTVIVTDAGIAGPGNIRKVIGHGLTDDGGVIIVLNSDVYWKFPIDKPVSVERWGVLASNSAAVNAPLLQDAFDFDGPIYVPDNTYDYDTGLTRLNGQGVICDGILNFTGSGEDAFTFGQLTVNTFSDNASESSLRVSRDTRDWTDDFAGIRLINMLEMSLRVYIEDFAYGIAFTGDKSCSYNQVSVQRIKNCRDSFLFNPTGSAGFCNQNNIWGGRVSTAQSIVGQTVDINGVVFRNDSSGSAGINAIIFHGTSFELSSTTTGDKHICYGDPAFTGNTRNARECLFNDVRFEFSGFVVGGAELNDFVFKLTEDLGPATLQQTLVNGATPADNTALILNSFYTPWRDAVGDDEARVIAKLNRSDVANLASGNLAASGQSLFWNGGSQIFQQRTAGDAESDKIIMASGATGIGVLLRVNQGDLSDYQRKIGVKVNSIDSGGRLIVAAFDSSFSQLSSNDDCTLSYNATPEAYRTGSDITPAKSEFTFAFSENFAYLFIGISAGTASAGFNSMEVFALGAVSQVYDREVINALGVGSVPVPMSKEAVVFSDSIPAAGTASDVLSPGSLVRNFDITSGGTILVGWIYDEVTNAWLENNVTT